MLATIIPAYAYEEYADDPDIQAFFYAYNSIAQGYLDSLNGLNLPIYTAPSITGALLDWVGLGIYGMPRPVISGTSTPTLGPYNTFMYNVLPYNGYRPGTAAPFYGASDDLYKRILTWNFYKGDGFQFNIPWLKRRIERFLNGVNGTDIPNDQQYDISVTIPSAIELIMSIPNTYPEATAFQSAMAQGLLPVPFQYQTVTVTTYTPTAPDAFEVADDGAFIVADDGAFMVMTS